MGRRGGGGCGPVRTGMGQGEVGWGGVRGWKEYGWLAVPLPECSSPGVPVLS